ncbi:hypothetical protein [Nitrolancea hollandica]|nr:hypothetical protein [Nitrolancea hollandica]
MEGLLFILLGLQWSIVVPATAAYSFGQLLSYVLIVSLAVIVVRLFWAFSIAYFPWVISRGWRSHELASNWREQAIIAWARMRGH